MASHGQPRHQGLDARLADAEGPAADDDSGAGLGGRKQLAAPSIADAPLAIDPRRAPLAGRGDPRPRVRRPRGARPGHAAVVSAAARDASTTSRVSRRRCIIRRKTRICSASCARARASSTRRSTSSSGSTSSGHRARRRARAEHRRLRGGSARRPAAASPTPSQRFATAQMQHMMLETKVIIPAARKHLTDEDWAEIASAFATNGDPRFSVDNDEEYPPALRANPESRAGPVQAHRRRPDSNVQFNNSQGRRTTMHHHRQHPARLRRSATAIAARHSGTVRRAGAVQAFEIDTGNPDIEMRWDNTFRYNLGGRVAVAGPGDHRQPEQRRRRPQLRARARSSPTGSTSCPSSTSSGKRSYGFSRERGAAGTTTPTAASTTRNTATANTLVNGLPVAGRAERRTRKRYAKGASGEWLDAFVFANFESRGMPVERQGRPAHGVLGRQPAARRRDPRRVVRAELARPHEGLRARRARSEGAVPSAAAASRCRRSRTRTCRSPASGSTTGRRCACRSRAAT